MRSVQIESYFAYIKQLEGQFSLHDPMSKLINNQGWANQTPGMGERKLKSLSNMNYTHFRKVQHFSESRESTKLLKCDNPSPQHPY